MLLNLQEINELNEDLAAKIILEAREDWFKSGIISEDSEDTEDTEDSEGLDQEQESEEQ